MPPMSAAAPARGGRRHYVGLLTRSVNRSDISNLLPAGIGKTSPCQADHSQHHENNSKYFIHHPVPHALRKCTISLPTPAKPLFVKILLSLADFLLNFAGHLFVLAFNL